MTMERYPDPADDRGWRGRTMREEEQRQRVQGAERHASREPGRRHGDGGGYDERRDSTERSRGDAYGRAMHEGGEDYPDTRSRAFRDARWADEPGREEWPDHDTDPRERDAWRARRFEGPYDERTVERYRGTVDPQQYVGPDPYRGMETRRARSGFEEPRHGRRLEPESRDWSERERSRGDARFAGVGPKGYRRDDARIRDDVCDRLTDDPYVDASDITVSVANGEVTLDGTVPDRRHKRAAEDCLESLPGIREINNRLRVQAAGSTAPVLP